MRNKNLFLVIFITGIICLTVGITLIFAKHDPTKELFVGAYELKKQLSDSQSKLDKCNLKVEEYKKEALQRVKDQEAIAPDAQHQRSLKIVRDATCFIAKIDWGRRVEAKAGVLKGTLMDFEKKVKTLSRQQTIKLREALKNTPLPTQCDEEKKEPIIEPTKYSFEDQTYTYSEPCSHCGWVSMDWEWK